MWHPPMFAIWKSSLVPAPISPRVGTLTSKKQTAIHSCTVELVGMKTTLRASSCVHESAPMLVSNVLQWNPDLIKCQGTEKMCLV